MYNVFPFNLVPETHRTCSPSFPQKKKKKRKKRKKEEEEGALLLNTNRNRIASIIFGSHGNLT